MTAVHAITLQVQLQMKLRIKVSHIFKLGVRNRLEFESVMPVIFKKLRSSLITPAGLVLTFCSHLSPKKHVPSTQPKKKRFLTSLRFSLGNHGDIVLRSCSGSKGVNCSK